MDVQYEGKLRCDLLQAWREGNGNIKATNLSAKILSHRMRGDEDVARFHFNAVKKVAQGPLPIPEAHMILLDCYRRGWAVNADPKKALHYLELAIENGHDMARWYLACYLMGDDKLASVLPPDPERAMAIFRDLSRNSKDSIVTSLARREAASYIVKHFFIHEISCEDLELVNGFSESLDIVGMDYIYLALFYAEGVTGSDYSGPTYRKARELFIAGTKSQSEQVRNLCSAQLDAWGIQPTTAQAPAPALTGTQKAGQAIKVTGQFAGLAGILVFWSLVGTFLLSVTAAINAVTLPIIIAVVVVGLLIKALRRG